MNVCERSSAFVSVRQRSSTFVKFPQHSSEFRQKLVASARKISHLIDLKGDKLQNLQKNYQKNDETLQKSEFEAVQKNAHLLGMKKC